MYIRKACHRVRSLPIYLLVLLWAVLISRPAASQETAPDQNRLLVTRVIIEITGPPRHQKEWAELARSLIRIQKNDRYSDQKMRNAIRALEASKRFQSIFADTRSAGDAVEVIFQLSPFPVIKDIRIQGGYPLFDEEIIRALSISVGDAYIADEMHRQAEGIESRFGREGFIHPQVTVFGREDPKDGYVVVHVDIEQRGHFFLDEIRFIGNRSFSDWRLRNLMDSWRPLLKKTRSGRFREQVLKADIRNLIHFYRKKGFADVTLAPEVNKKEKTQCVKILIKVDEGPRYRIRFNGRKAFSKHTLMSDVAIFKEGNKNNRGMRKTVRQIKKRYRASGFLDTRVRWEAQPATVGGQNEKQVMIIIDEGPQTVVQEVNLVGNHNLEGDRIKNEIQTAPSRQLRRGHFVPEVLASDIFKIKTLYLKEGYASTVIQDTVKYSSDRTSASVTLRIDEGVKSMVTGLKLDGVSAVSPEEALRVLTLKPGVPYRPYRLKIDENALSALISENGHPHVSVKGRALISPDLAGAEVSYRVNEGPRVTMGKTFFLGNFRTRRSLLEKEIGIKPGEPFSPKKMLEGQRNLRNMDTLQSVRFKLVGLKEKAESVDLFVEIEEKKPYHFELGAGYQSDKRLFAQAQLGDRNLFGFNKNAFVGGEISEIGYRIDLSGTDPRLFGTRISAFTGLYAEETEEYNLTFGTRSYGGNMGITLPKWHDLSFKTNLNYERRDQFQRQDVLLKNPADTDEFEPRNIFKLTSSGVYDRRDSFVRPRKGLYTSLSVDFSKGIDNDLDDFFRYRYGLRYYYTPWQRLTFAMIGRAGFIDPYGTSEKVPDDQLFFLGGISDVRGYAENLLMYDQQGDPVGGRGALSASAEMRLDMGRNIELTLFYDVGKIIEPEGDSVTDSERASLGVGLRYHTPVGPIGFLYGFKLNPREEEDPGRFHFSIGYTF